MKIKHTSSLTKLRLATSMVDGKLKDHKGTGVGILKLLSKFLEWDGMLSQSSSLSTKENFLFKYMEMLKLGLNVRITLTIVVAYFYKLVKAQNS